MAPLLSAHSPTACGGKVVAPATKGGMHFLARRAVVQFSCRQRRYKKWRRRRRTSPAGTVSQPIGKPFNGQAKGLLWLTWRSYAGPPQYFIPPEGGALTPPVRRSRSQAEPWQPRARGPMDAIRPSAPQAQAPSGIQLPADFSQKPTVSLPPQAAGTYMMAPKAPYLANGHGQPTNR